VLGAPRCLAAHTHVLGVIAAFHIRVVAWMATSVNV
jgi:hypothetical protein